MKWLKHYSDASKSDALQIIKDKFGVAGIGRYWILIELIAQRMKVENNFNPELIITVKELAALLECKQNKLSTFLECLKNVLKMNLEQSENIIKIFYPKLLELNDNSSKVLLATNKQLVKIDKIRLDKNIIKNKEKENSVFSFEEIWNKYPCKKGTKAAKKHFMSSVKSKEDFNNINIALENYLKSSNYKKGYIQNGSTWFNNWRDWIEQENKQQDLGDFNATYI